MMKIRMIKYVCLAVTTALVMIGSRADVYAQTPDVEFYDVSTEMSDDTINQDADAIENVDDGVTPQTEQQSISQLEQGIDGDMPEEQGFQPSNFPSLLFTYWERTALQDAKNARGLTRAPSDYELSRALKENMEERVKPPPEERYVTLNGIVYKTKSNWTIWLNGIRVTPNAIPKEAMDLKVYKEYIELKWFDEYTNRIIPIRLRTHQRFNIDTRIFLPG